MSALVLSSDWHLDVATAGVDRFDDICQAIDVGVDKAIEMKADAYVMCGDLANPNTVRSHRSVTKAVQVQRRCHENNVHPIFVAGNHDVIEDGSGLTTMSALAATGFGDVFERPVAKSMPWGGLIALPFTPLSHDYDPDQFIRDCHSQGVGKVVAQQSNPRSILILGHLNLKGITAGSETTDMPRGRNVYWPIDAIQECFPDALVVGGHYHTPQEYQGVHIIGSQVRLRFDERDNEPGYTVLEI